MKRQAVLGLLGAGLFAVAIGVVAIGILPPGADAAPAASAADVVGGRNFYFCAAFQAIKIVGLFTASAPLVLAGAIGGGLSCGFGW